MEYCKPCKTHLLRFGPVHKVIPGGPGCGADVLTCFGGASGFLYEEVEHASQQIATRLTCVIASEHRKPDEAWGLLQERFSFPPDILEVTAVLLLDLQQASNVGALSLRSVY